MKPVAVIVFALHLFLVPLEVPGTPLSPANYTYECMKITNSDTILIVLLPNYKIPPA